MSSSQPISMNERNVWRLSATPDEIARSNEVRLAEFVAFFAFGFPARGLLGFPVVELVAGVMIVVAFLRKAQYRALPVVTTLGMMLAATYLISTWINHVTDVRRLIHIGGYLLLFHAFSTGRIHARSAAIGLATGLSVSIVVSAVELGGGALSARMSGEFADPNGGSFYMLALGSVALAQLNSKLARRLLILLVSAGVILTLSRTGLMALAFAYAWMLNARIMGWFTKLFLSAGMIWTVGHVPKSWQYFGPFSDRVGSDALRHRIELASQAAVERSGYFGNGPGTSVVNVSGLRFFYHSSYLALRNEVGWVGTIILLGLLLWLMFSLIRLPRAQQEPLLEIAIVVTAMMAVSVGEILVELPTAVVIGLAMQHLSRALAWEVDDAQPLQPALHRRQ